jgi:transposase
MRVVITEHRFSKGEIPTGFYNEVSYGDNIKAQAVLLMAEGIISHKRLSEIISGMTDKTVKLSTGTLSKFQSDFAARLNKSGELDAIKDDLLNGGIMHTDDTSMRVLKRIVYPQDDESEEPLRFEVAERGSYRATIRTHSNEKSTLYTANPRKNQKGIERDGILPLYMGTLCHDHEAKFFNYGKENAGCGGHLTRDLKGLSDSYNCQWADKMRRFILGMNVYKNNDLTSGLKACGAEKLALFENEYTQLIEQGREAHRQMHEDEWGRKEFNAMLNRLSNSKDSYMLFMRDYKVPFTNNLAERDLRSEKTKEKVSGMFRSWDGIENHVKARSFMSTLKKRGMDLFSCIKMVIQQMPVLTG